MARAVPLLILALMSFSVLAEQDAWVTSNSLNRRTCPDANCGVVGTLLFREKAPIFEKKNGWVRITKYYDASCVNGKSEYVDSGNRTCNPANGINDGKFAEWVSAKYLSTERPADPSAGATGDHALVRGSDDYQIHKNAFAKAASQLISAGRCSAADFKEMGGWMKSSTHRSKPVYFTYCGGMTASNKIYLDASTGKITNR